MTRTRSHAPAVWLALIAALVLTPWAIHAQAQAKGEAQDQPGNIASTWILWTKPGPQADFEAAIKTHAAWRKQAGEPMQWRIYAPVAGDDLERYVIRSGGHHWSDFDAAADWELKAQAGATYEAQVGGHVAHVAHHFAEDDSAHSYLLEERDYRYFGVNLIRFNPGAESDFFSALKTVVAAAKAGKWPRSWSVSHLIGGSDDIVVVWPYTSYADMQRIEPGFAAVLAKQVGSEEEARSILDRLGAAIEHSEYTVYEYRPDLSTPE